MSNLLMATDLHRILSEAAVFAEKDETLTPINQVRLESDGTQVLAVGTDRFTIGVSRAAFPQHGHPSWQIPASCDLSAATDGPVFGIDLLLADVQGLIKTARTYKRDADARTVAVEFEALPDEVPFITFRFGSGEVRALKGSEWSFPKWRQLFPASGDGVARAATGFSPEYVARFAHVRTDTEAPRMRMVSFDDKHSSSGGVQKPITVTIGENFVGLIMPVRLPGDEQSWERPGWLDIETQVSEIRS